MDQGPEGYLYVLSVKDIDLPVSKIGNTSRIPSIRCAEINQSSTGDFIWEVAYQIAVNDAKKLEALVHEKLTPLRQKRREFFNLYPEDAVRAINSILSAQTGIVQIPDGEIATLTEPTSFEVDSRTKEPARHTVDPRYVRFMDSFTHLLGIKGRPFGALNKRYYGLSDGREGVQWNLSVDPDDNMVRIGVNLEGMKYNKWPIARFIVAELQTPTLPNLIPRLEHAEHIVLHFTRDAWQVTSRPAIREEHLGGRDLVMTEIDPAAWKRTLDDALGCLDPARNYQGRAQQEVTIIKTGGQDDQKKIMEVSPHLTVWTAMNPEKDSDAEVAAAVRRLKPVHEWVSRIVEN